MSININRRQFSQAVMGAAALGLFATACSPGDAPSDPNTEVTLRFAWWGNAERAAATQKAIALFEAANPKIKVKGEPGDFNGYFDKLATSVAAKDAPDVFTLGGAYPAEYANRGALLDLATVDSALDLSRLDPSAVSNGQVKGVQYGVSTGANALAMVINPSVFKAAGVDVPDDTSWTWEDFRTTSASITTQSPAGTFGSASVLTHDSLDAFARQRGEALYTEDGQLGLTAPTVEDYFAFSLNLAASKASPSATELVEQSSISVEQSLMGTGKAGMMLTWSNSLRALSSAVGVDLELRRLPGETPTPGIWLQSSQYYAISAQSEKAEAAAKLIDFMVNSEYAARLLLTDRGVPSNGAVRTAISNDLSASGQSEVAYLDIVGKTKFAPTFIGPTGSTAVSEITARINTDVLFGKASPAEAAKQWMQESADAIL
ncbi:carbohydrate ABC transporter substrate-binding protein, CUT1 family [Arthrobacter alpinus]|uniref:Carbohydrate ABC transporter substrate-binding protein, CUT1 family n=1 Tax=Arthrobacter alpinus TaxID=656366 RepID=A0A1H5MGQ0_9MICC|nr:sugar ABC transporter substrate-binding protein [Arthrobacter alpinus]SEE88260.1 carbohydrate ABC transporter substrate-binding protein, CUT1 family [Arthrobacter alpinus]